MKTSIAIAILAGTAAAVGCSSLSGSAPQVAVAVQDGEIALPGNYASWPKFLGAVQRPDVKQVREIYVNPAGYNARAGQPYAHGTTFVMENYAAQQDAAGTLRRDAGGKLVKGRLLRVFVMSKGPGYGSAAPAELANGEWAYASFDAACMKTTDALAPCRTCHLPQASKDFVFRSDEFKQARSAGTY
jgi:hemoglobin